MTPIVVCVLKTGGDFDVSHVKRLADQVRAHSSGICFTCLTDDPAVELGAHVDWLIRLKHGWVGWYSKIEALRLPGPCLYLDLDVTIVSDLEPLIEAVATHDFLMVESLWGPDDPNRWNSSVMGWRKDAPAHLFDTFKCDPPHWMKRCEAKDAFGDQGFIRLAYEGEITAWQAAVPGALVSFKRGCLMGEGLGNCAIVVSHGLPRPWSSGGADEWLRARGLLA